MPDDKHLDRRAFLQITAGALIACTVTRLVASESHFNRNSAPLKPVILKSSELEVVFDGGTGMPYEYRLPNLSTRFAGDEEGRSITATICARPEWKFGSGQLTLQTTRTSSGQADFLYLARVNQKPAARFTLRYALDRSTLQVVLLDVQELSGCELIDVALPSLISVSEGDGAVWLGHGDQGGSLTQLREASPGHLTPNPFWGNVLTTLPVVMIGNGKAVCVQEVTSYMDGTELRVTQADGSRRASLGTTKVHRVNGSLCYDMNAGKDTPRNCGNPKTPNLLVRQESSCRLDFIGDVNNDGAADWLDGAQFLQRRMPPIPKHLYDDAFVYGILCDQPLFEKPTATFEDCERIIRDVAALTDNARQIVHLWGWQYKGKDTGYPAVAEVNPRIGGYDGMMRLMQRAKDYNGIVTISDNYDDAYRSSPAWNEDWIARRPDGKLWESRNWTGENSYILGMAKYVKSAGLDRVRYTCERYKLPETTHVDVLSYFSIRNDWDPVHPAGGIDNLEGRYAVFDEFANHGVDVTSEALRYAFLGKISLFWYMTGPAPCPLGGKPIPLLATIYRNSAVWGQSGQMPSLLEGILKMLFYNGYAHASFRGAGNLNAITDLYYLMMVLWFKLHARNVTGFRRDGERTVIDLEGNGVVDLDWAKQTYVVTLNGIEIARDLQTYCPLDEDRIAFYSATSADLAAHLPPGWRPNDLMAVALSTGDRKETRVSVANGKIAVHANAHEPVIVYRSSEKALQQPA